VLAVLLALALWPSAHDPARSRVLATTPQLSLDVPSPLPPARVDRDARAIARVLRRTPYVVSGGGERREIALTFDDGPGPYTPRVLAQLRRLHVPATFFEVGFMVPLFAAAVRRELRMHAAIGDHTELHASLARLPGTAQRRQILVQTQQLHRLGAPFPRLFRPPYGAWNGTTLKLTRHLRMLMVLWSIDTEDYRQPGVRAIVRAVLTRAKPGAIVLLHDAGGTRTQTIAALPAIVHGLRRRGYGLVTVPQLMREDPPRRVPHLRHDLSGG
jgi:peptidoglycan/xylan/chitin deacetylase (PgdA/CDA1 family)